MGDLQNQKTTMSKTYKKRNRDHDIFIKGILSLNELVLLLLYRYLPYSLQSYVDFSTLKLLSDAHIDNKLLAQYSDSIHECALLKEQLPEHIRNMADLPTFRFCFLWEHKSAKPYEPIESQNERYRYGIISSDIKNNPKYIVIDIQSTSEEEIEKMVDLGVLRGVFIALKHGHEKNFFKKDMEKVLKFVETLPIQYVFQSFFKMLLEYMQRRSGLGSEKFNKIFEQSKSKFNMAATAKKTIFDWHENKVKKEANLKIQEANTKAQEANTKAQEANTKLQEMNRTSVMILIKNTQLADNQIVELLKLPLSFVQAIRKEVTGLS